MTVSSKVLLVLFVIALFVLIRWNFSGFSLATIIGQRDAIQSYVDKNYYAAVALYMSILIGAVLLAMPVSLILTTAGGIFFGTLWATIYSVIGATIGATCSFLLFRYLLRAPAQHFYGSSLKKFNEAFKRHGSSYLLFMELLPITPFMVIIIVASLSSVSLLTFMWTTCIGILPGSCIYAYAGSNLKAIQVGQSILTWQLALCLVMLALMALLPLAAEGIKNRWSSNK